MVFFATLKEQLGMFWTLVDILILGLIVYELVSLLGKTHSIQLVRILGLLIAIYLGSYLFQFTLVFWFFDKFLVVFIIGLLIIYQSEFRLVLTQLRIGKSRVVSQKATEEQLDSLIDALEVLVTKRRGALVVFRRKMPIKNIIETGTRLDANFSSMLLLTIFDHDTPLHDGAVVIDGNKILAAGCFLPLTEQTNIVRSFGARHRAAQGMAEASDSVVLVVSEETGTISLACNERLYYDLSAQELKNSLISFLNYQDTIMQDQEGR